eukprot:GHVN01061694.1.p2 GENE.GHVN01061694.1~~GHVN01061694.1.p2  ORF type:complete len:121 (-),score=22.35 GHVN01061694.1:852-1214(-)
MGYLICFDSTDRTSWEEAVRVHVTLTDSLEKNKSLTPVIFFVATKMDKMPQDDDEASIITQAEYYVQKAFMRLWKTSAADGKNITSMFRDMIHLILGNTMLWAVEYEEEEEPEKEGCKAL